jgi:hypothetical protein
MRSYSVEMARAGSFSDVSHRPSHPLPAPFSSSPMQAPPGVRAAADARHAGGRPAVYRPPEEPRGDQGSVPRGGLPAGEDLREGGEGRGGDGRSREGRELGWRFRFRRE